ncbi:MAG TPA: N-acetylmuramoyl-L-alanine amidase [Bdellovibrionota bacterium]|nr:N-acetylmuramoyl-L-alanine amidase [Bdellovibrionota bacterium]
MNRKLTNIFNESTLIGWLAFSLVAFRFLIPELVWASSVPPGVLNRNLNAFRVVIDPGHGGADYGTIYDNGRIKIAEKNITLALARRVAEKLRKRGYTVFLTRNADREVALPARTAMANKLHANVFISIHMNSTASPQGLATEGIETYILNNATDESSRRLAHFENTVLGAGSPDGEPESLPPENLDVALILKDLRLDANLSESKRLACAIQDGLVSATSQLNGRRPIQHRNRGVKQALFYVLLGADMPSALLEAGFLTHPRDRAIVLSPEGQNAMSGSIVKAIEQFRRTKGTTHSMSALSRCKVN